MLKPSATHQLSLRMLIASRTADVWTAFTCIGIRSLARLCPFQSLRLYDPAQGALTYAFGVSAVHRSTQARRGASARRRPNLHGEPRGHVRAE